MVHVLLCTRNGGPWLEAQLDSLVAQSHGNWQLWASDDQSSDDSRTILERFADRHPGRVAMIMDGPGKGSAANFLSLLCHPDLPAGYVTLCDQDDIWMPHKLEYAMAQLRPWAGTPCGWSARYIYTDAEMRPLTLSQHWARGPSLENALVQNIMSGHTLTLNPEALALIRRAGPVAVPHHDWWIYLLLMACDGRALIDSEVVLLYRQHGRNTMRRRAGLSGRIERVTSVLNGALNRWILANLDALAKVDVPLSTQASELATRFKAQPTSRASTALGNFPTHRQNSMETLALALAKRLRRL